MTAHSITLHARAAFSADQRATLDVLMDLLIPASPDGRMPAARALSLYDSAVGLRAGDRALFDRGLADLDRRAHAAHGMAFARLSLSEAKAMVDALRREGSAFMGAFMAQTVGRYVAHPRVMPLLGLEARPLWPKGNEVAEGDWSLLDTVKQREKIYRKV